MPAQSLIYLGQGIYLLIGILAAAGLLILFVYASWTGIKVWISETRKGRAWEEYRRETFREDGKPYPRHTPGVCEGCGRPHDKVYHPHSGEKLCPPCYDRFWRSEAQPT